jgi:peptidyl-tRNA hydrolase, PTH1 family
MYAIIGLGNPGSKYSGSRHNLGFRVVEALAGHLKAKRPVMKYWSLCAPVLYKGKELLLAQPLTYMNLSGRAVKEILHNKNINLVDLLIIYDDLDLPPGLIRMRQRGGSAGHRGLQSIIDALGTDQFARLRIGIGKAPPGLETAEYVTGPLDEPDCSVLAAAVERAVEATLLFIDEGSLAVMNRYNRVGGDKDGPPKIADDN